MFLLLLLMACGSDDRSAPGPDASGSPSDSGATDSGGIDPTQSTDPTAPADGARVVLLDERVRLARPGEELTFTVRLEDAFGDPLVGVPLRLLAPDQPVQRHGWEGLADTPVAARVTDSAGQASATLVLGPDPDLFSVDVLVDGTRLLASYAISSLDDDSPPQVDLATFEAFVDPGGAAEGAVVHGPWLVPAGAAVHTAPDEHQLTGAASWLAYVDPLPWAESGHTVEVVQADASADVCAAGCRRTPRERAPSVTLPGGDRVRLLPPHDRNAVFHAVPPVTSARRAAVRQGTCAMVIADTDHQANARFTEDFFRDTFGAEQVRRLVGADVEALDASVLADFVADGCEHVFVAATGHGSDWHHRKRPILEIVRPDDEGTVEQQVVFWGDLAEEWAEVLGGTELTLLVHECFAERAIGAMQDRGLEGAVFTSSSHDYESYRDDDGYSEFFRALFAAWEQSPEPAFQGAWDRLQDQLREGDVQPDEAQDHLTQTLPRTAFIDPGHLDWDDEHDEPQFPTVSLGPTEDVASWTFRRPIRNSSFNLVDPRTLPMIVTVEADDPDAVTLLEPAGGQLRFEIADIEKSITVRVDAEGDHTVRVHARAKHNAWEGVATVSAPYFVPEIDYPACAEGARNVRELYQFTFDPAVHEVFPGIPTLGSGGEVVQWGGDGTATVLRTDAHGSRRIDEAPLLLGGTERTLVTDLSYPMPVAADGSFPFTAWSGGDRYGIYRWAHGDVREISLTERPNGFDHLTRHVHTNRDGRMVFGTSSQPIVTDDAAPVEVVFRSDGVCTHGVAAVGDPFPVGSAAQMERLYVGGVLRGGDPVFLAEDTVLGQTAVIRQTESGELQTMIGSGDAIGGLPGDVTSVSLVDVSDFHAIVWATLDGSQGEVVALVRAGEEAVPLLRDLAPAPGTDGLLVLVEEVFVARSGDVAVTAALLEPTAPFTQVGAALLVEGDAGLEVVARYEDHAPCLQGMRWSRLDNDLTAWWAGDTLYVRTHVFHEDDLEEPREVLYAYADGRFGHVMDTASPLFLSDGITRQIAAIQQAETDDTGSERRPRYRQMTTDDGQLVLDLVYEEDASGANSYGTVLVGEPTLDDDEGPVDTGL